MLSRLSIRDIVLIDKLDIEFDRGLAILTGETGAGKSILLDAFSLALGGRGEQTLVRHGAAQGQVRAVFDVVDGHPARALLAANDIIVGSELILRRVQLADGRTAHSSTTSGSATRCSAIAALVEIHGQHDERALIDAATHRQLVDAFGGLESAAECRAHLQARRDAREAADGIARVEGKARVTACTMPSTSRPACAEAARRPRSRSGVPS